MHIQNQPYCLIDISMGMDAFTFEGDQPFEVVGPLNWVTGSNPEFVYDFKASTQTGTHIQGPHYFLEYGRKIETFPLEAFEGWATVVQIEKRGEDTSREDLRRQLEPLTIADEIVLLRSGHMDEVIREGKLDPARRPGLSLNAARYLVEEKGVRMIAIDSVGLESRVTANYEVNVYLCQQEILILEGVVDLHRISKPRVFLEAFPLKMCGVEGTPCRAIVKEYSKEF